MKFLTVLGLLTLFISSNSINIRKYEGHLQKGN